MTACPTVLLSGMFDMENYGDLLFPLMAEHRLAPYGYRVVPVAPTARRAAIGDALAPIDLAEMIGGSEAPIAGIVVGGGYLIHAHTLDFIEDYDTADAGDWCGAGLWLGATLAAALRDAPIAWNAPGVPHPFSTRQQQLVDAALRAGSYIALRDHGSARLLAAPDDVPVQVIPDPIAGIAELWPRASLAPHFRTLLQRKGIPGMARLLAIHVRNRSVAGVDLGSLAAAIRDVALAHDLTPALIAVGRSHEDPALARRLAPHLGLPHLLLDDPSSLREITAALAHSVLYVGASLHGYIVSAAYGTPGVLIGRPAYHKFSGFLDHIERPQDLARDWPSAWRLAQERLRDGRGQQVPDSVAAALDRHWQAIVGALREPQRRRAARQDFAIALLRSGLRADGPGWALRSFATDAMRRAGGAVRRRFDDVAARGV